MSFEASYDWDAVKKELDKQGLAIIREVRQDNRLEDTPVHVIGELLPRSILRVRKFYTLHVEILES